MTASDEKGMTDYKSGLLVVMDQNSSHCAVRKFHDQQFCQKVPQNELPNREFGGRRQALYRLDQDPGLCRQKNWHRSVDHQLP